MAQIQGKLLVTGFEPFGGQALNPAWEAVRLLPDQVGGFEISKLLVPTVFGLAAEVVLAQAEIVQPDAILCVGQAAGRASVTPEWVAINLRYGRIADNAGICPRDEPVIPEGPDAYFSTLPARTMADAIQRAGLPGEVSYSAGTFVCNDLLYCLLQSYHGSRIRVGFVHVPLLPEQAAENQPSLPLSHIVSALEVAIKVI